jgi:hypothetical protein
LMTREISYCGVSRVRGNPAIFGFASAKALAGRMPRWEAAIQ